MNEFDQNNQYPNNQYPNNPDPNNQYPNNQYPNNPYPNNQYPNNQAYYAPAPDSQYPNVADATMPVAQAPSAKPSFLKQYPWVLPLIIGLVVLAAAFIFLKGGSGPEKVTRMIDSIGTVTLNSENKIEKAEAAYEALASDEKEEVENYSDLVSARDSYDRISNAYDAIEAIGTVEATEACGDRIEAARDAYDACDDEEKEQVTNEETLLTAEETFDGMKVDLVINTINSIGTVTLESKGTVEAARAAYNDLSSDQKEKITNYSVLTDAENTLKALKQAAADQYLGQMRKTGDAVRGITWYEPYALPEYIDERCFALPYIAQSGSDTLMYIKADYTGDDWIFWEKITFSVDGVNTVKNIGYFNVTRDNEAGYVWEYADISVGESEIALLESIVSSGTTIVRFEGDDYYYDLTISDADKAAIRLVLDAYAALK